MTVTVARWTLADYHQMVETGLLQDRRVELLNGLVIEMAPEGPEHAECSTLLNTLFGNASEGRYRVREAKPISLITSNSEPEPDIALVRDKSYRQAHPDTSRHFFGGRVFPEQLGEGYGSQATGLCSSGYRRLLGGESARSSGNRLPPASRRGLQASRDCLCRGADATGISGRDRQRESIAGGLTRAVTYWVKPVSIS